MNSLDFFYGFKIKKLAGEFIHLLIILNKLLPDISTDR